METNNIQKVAELAKQIAEQNAFEYAGNYGRGVFKFCVHVDTRNDSITLSAKTNAQIKEKQAQEELTKVWVALIVAVKAAGVVDGLLVTKHRGRKVWRQGFVHMGHFDTTGFARGIEAKTVAA